jgi:hypothetical protein
VRRWKGSRSHLLNGSKNPNVPIEKLKTGGTMPVLKREEACRIVPSPPSVITKSIGDEVVSAELVNDFEFSE